MNRIPRTVKILSIISELDGKVESSKKFQKLVFLAQFLGDDFGQEFKFHFYSVYSSSLTFDLNYAKEAGLIDFNKNYLPHTIELKEEGSDFLKQVNAHYEGIQNIEIIKILNKETPTFLEVLSTIVYLNMKNYPKGKIEKKLREIKGHLERHFDKAFGFARDILYPKVIMKR